MMNLENFFKNPFTGSHVSDDNLKSFAEDDLARLVANNTGGEFTDIIAATASAYTDYFGKMSSEDTKTVVKESLTIANNNEIAAFKKDVSETEGFIRFKYHLGSVVYQEFYPHGITEYSTADKGNVDTLSTRFYNACVAHTADMPAGTVTLFENHKDNLQSTRLAQLSKIGEVSAEKVGTAAARLALEIQLTANLHFVGFTYPTDVQKCMSFFDQSIIHRAVNHSSDGIGQIQGIITNAANEPLSGVTVHVGSASVADRHTGADGKYKTPNLPVGMHSLRITKAGFVTQFVNIDVLDEGVTPLDVVMVAE